MLWEHKTKQTLMAFASQRSLWAGKQIEEFKKTIDLQKSMRISRKFSSDMLSIVEAEKSFNAPDPLASFRVNASDPRSKTIES